VKKKPALSPLPLAPELVIITGISGSGKGTVLKCLEDLGYYSVDNLPIELIPKFAELTRGAPQITHAALVFDIREGRASSASPSSSSRSAAACPPRCCSWRPTTRRSCAASARPAGPIRLEPSAPSPARSRPSASCWPHSRTRRPCREHLQVHRARVARRHRRKVPWRPEQSKIMIYVTSFGYRNGVPADSDLSSTSASSPTRITSRSSKSSAAVIPRWPATSAPSPRPLSSSSASPTCWSTPPPLHSGRQELSHHRLRMHRRPAPLGHDRRRDRRRLARAGFKVKATHRDIVKSA